MAAANKPRVNQELGRTASVLQTKRTTDKVVLHPRDLPGNIILIHGVNDVGMGYSNVEEGLCTGLEQRLYRRFKPGAYKLPTQAGKDKLEDDPDAVYFKRAVDAQTDSPVIPFYWGYRESSGNEKIVNGQFTDRFGNRLDKDLSKGGGPFGNATSNLADMWNRGIGAPLDPVHDPLRPIRNGPGRMYMVLAALRLACLIASIRRYESKDAVTLVAHSQGCLLSLLAQAYLMDKGEKPADTLILTHPPYSLEERPAEGEIRLLSIFSVGEDAAMKPYYNRLSNWQSLHGRLQTLINIVQGVAQAKATEPAFHSISEKACKGMVESRWQPDADRDNRGKVFLYFCPEDMTVALDNMRGIGWQGVPDFADGARAGYVYRERKLGRGSDYDVIGRYEWGAGSAKRMPLKELGEGFRQRVFTAKQRLDPDTRKIGPMLVGQAPCDFPLRVNGEDDHAHVAAANRYHRGGLPIAHWPIDPHAKLEQQRLGIRRINAEPLKVPCIADVTGGQMAPDKIPATSMYAKLPMNERGPYEEVDPITAAVAMTSSQGIKVWNELRPHPWASSREEKAAAAAERRPTDSVTSVPGGVPGGFGPADLERMTHAYNQEKHAQMKLDEKAAVDPNEQYKIIRAVPHENGKVVAMVQESLNAARRRWQHEVSAKSFHCAIFESSGNHQRVTAYDVAIGSGKASSDPLHYTYLCALADWRLKIPMVGDPLRPGILTWDKFIRRFGIYYRCELDWCQALIQGNATYYSTGKLPTCLPVLTGSLWDIVICETVAGERINQPDPPKEQP